MHEKTAFQSPGLSQSTHVVISIRQVSNEEHGLHAFSTIERPDVVFVSKESKLYTQLLYFAIYCLKCIAHEIARHKS